MTYTYRPQGVCSQQMRLELEGTTVKGVQILGGCDGNLQALSRLVTGMDARDAIAKLRGIRCGYRPTSCPDQLARALEQALER